MSKDVLARLDVLQTGNPDKLSIEYLGDGGEDFEYYIHKALEKYNIHREWFEFSKKDMIDIMFSVLKKGYKDYQRCWKEERISENRYREIILLKEENQRLRDEDKDNLITVKKDKLEWLIREMDEVVNIWDYNNARNLLSNNMAYNEFYYDWNHFKKELMRK
ncbi:MAG: GIY-YIG nuclease family protein [Candidatus Thorarchaeota archaeon]